MNPTPLIKDKNINMFIKKVAELKSGSLIRLKGKKYSYTMYWHNHTKDYDYKNMLFPPDELIESHILRLRHFYLQKSPINIFVILDRAYRLIQNQESKQSIAFVRKQFSTLFNTKFPEDLDFLVFKNTDEMLKTFLNGKYFHLDNELSEIIRSLDETSYKKNMYGFITALYTISMMLFLSSSILQNAFEFDQLKNDSKI